MSWIAFVLIVTSAGLHAGWNLLAKKSKMTPAFYTILCTICAFFWWHTVLWTPLEISELPLRFWLCLAGSIASDVLYCFGLSAAYNRLEMSTAYPMIRALPLLFIALLTTVLGLGAPLSLAAVTGMVVVFAGCLLMPLTDLTHFRWQNYLNKDILFVILVALGTTGYTIFDSQAIRTITESVSGISKPMISLTYYATRVITLTITLWCLVLLSPAGRAVVRDVWIRRDRTALYAGLFASCSYVLVLLSMGYVTNVSFVQVFRQMGMLIGVALGIFLLKEKCTLPKIIGVTLIVLGLILTVL